VLVPSAGPGSAPRIRVQQIVLEHLDAIWRTARRLGVPPADVDDVAQEVALVILRRESAIQAGKERAFVIGSQRRQLESDGPVEEGGNG